jgi:hypothetical protein
MNSSAQSRYLAICFREGSRNALHEVRHRQRRRLEILQSVRDAAQPGVSEVRSAERA